MLHVVNPFMGLRIEHIFAGCVIFVRTRIFCAACAVIAGLAKEIVVIGLHAVGFHYDLILIFAAVLTFGRPAIITPERMGAVTVVGN